MQFLHIGLVEAHPATKFEFPKTGGCIILRHDDILPGESAPLLTQDHIATEGYLLEENVDRFIPMDEFDNEYLGLNSDDPELVEEVWWLLARMMKCTFETGIPQ